MQKLILVLLMVWASNLSTKEIAITIDDAPRPSSYLSASERTQLLIKNLKSVKSPPVIFFATGQNLTEENTPNLLAYAKAGHFIAHHSDKHLWYHRTSVDDYQKDFLTAHEKFKELPNFHKFYRFPYLDRGRSKEKTNAMHDFLSKQDYQDGYVTVDNYDWYLDNLFQQAKKSKATIDMQALKDLYVKTMLEAAEFYNDAAIKYLERLPKHVLLLHDNDLAAYFLDDLIRAFRKADWKIISPLEAYQDPIAKQIPKTLATSQGRVAALARDNGAKPREFSHNAIEEDYLKQQFETLVSADRKCSLTELKFLEGQWQYRTQKNLYTENWQITDNGLKAAGKVIELQSGKLLNQEVINLSKKDDRVIYSALPSQNKVATDFKLVSCHNNRFAFINKAHDFPQLIVYTFLPSDDSKNDRLKVEVTNLNDKGFILLYQRINNR